MIIWHKDTTEKMGHVYGNVILAIVQLAFMKKMNLMIQKNVDLEYCCAVFVREDTV